MPLLAYFAVVGSVLLGLLFVAEAQLGPPHALTITTDFHGLPVRWQAPPTMAVLTVIEGLAPNMAGIDAQEAMASAVPPPTATPTTKVAKKAERTRKATRQHARKVDRPHGSRNPYAHSAMMPGADHGVFW
jgi:hypothetical protein